MPLAAGTRLGPYEITAPIGRGGMGEVYRARDTKLDRDVAIKVLPEEFASDEGRLARFQREAKLLAQLNHPNVATLHGLERGDDTLILVMELVEGETLSERIARESVPLEDALAIARQVATGLEAGHDKGIVHRDLKPANIMVTADNHVKILDYGLAKALGDEAAVLADSNSPTMTKAATQTGVILGTAAYMSPEQARGQAVDRRADIWAFGVVLCEMLTGRKLFLGDTVSEILAEVLKSEVDWSTLPAETPQSVRRLLRRCLERDRKKRLGWAGDALLEIDEASSEEGAGGGTLRARWPERVAWAALGLALGVGAFAFVGRGGDRVGPRSTRKLVIPTEGRTLLDTQAISPDGDKIAYVAGGKLWIRRLDRLEAREVPSSDGAELPFWSPDSELVGFAARDAVWKAAVDGGSPQRLCEFSRATFTGGTWNRNGDIVVGLQSSGATGELYRVSSSGGELELFAGVDRDRDALGIQRPQFLPNGRDILASVNHRVGTSLMVRTGGEWRSVDADGGSMTPAVYSASGHVLYVRARGNESQVFGIRFALENNSVAGDPFLVATNGYSPTVSMGGDLLYSVTMPEVSRVVWVDRDGRVEGEITESSMGVSAPALSPDGSRLYLTTDADFVGGGGKILDLRRGGSVLVPGSFAAWTPSGDALVFVYGADLFTMPSDGSVEPEPIVASEWAEYAPNVSRDGNYLAYYLVDPTSGRDLWYRPLAGQEEPKPFLVTPAHEVLPQISPDGGFVAYQSNTSGEWEIYVRPFPKGEGRWQVSVGGGVHPRWSRNGEEIIYVGDNALMAVPIETVPTFHPGVPTELFRGDDVGTDLRANVGSNVPLYDVSHDGERFVIVQGAAQGTSEIVLIENWLDELDRPASGN